MCDVCGSGETLDIPCLAAYGLRSSIVVCQHCGFVYVPDRRSEQEIADEWTNELFGDAYTSDVPYVSARLYWVAEEIDAHLSLADTTLADIGCGEGKLLRFLRSSRPDARYVGIDPSPGFIAKLAESGIQGVVGTAQAVAQSGDWEEAFDVITLTWTLENSNDCREVVRACRSMLRPGGHLVVATGSRILVPFKKPLSSYISSTRAPDTHAFRWSHRSLTNLLRQFGSILVRFSAAIHPST